MFLAVPLHGEARGLDDALDARWFLLEYLPEDLAFDSTGAAAERLADALPRIARMVGRVAQRSKVGARDPV
ncbi:MAG: hypothetical protein R3F34_17600 [Planctomycetota bacterium]